MTTSLDQPLSDIGGVSALENRTVADSSRGFARAASRRYEQLGIVSARRAQGKNTSLTHPSHKHLREESAYVLSVRIESVDEPANLERRHLPHLGVSELVVPEDAPQRGLVDAARVRTDEPVRRLVRGGECDLRAVR